jgi:hypothetical protein
MCKWVSIVGIFLLPATAAGSNIDYFSLPLFDEHGGKDYIFSVSSYFYLEKKIYAPFVSPTCANGYR